MVTGSRTHSPSRRDDSTAFDEIKLYSILRGDYHGRVGDSISASRGSASAIVFDIQRFSLHDGPGIRTTAFLKGCPLSCAWCQNPESQKANPEIAFYAERCARCFACRGACPERAILDGPERRVDYARCIGCGACARVCPKDCQTHVPADQIAA